MRHSSAWSCTVPFWNFLSQHCRIHRWSNLVGSCWSFSWFDATTPCSISVQWVRCRWIDTRFCTDAPINSRFPLAKSIWKSAIEIVIIITFWLSLKSNLTSKSCVAINSCRRSSPHLTIADRSLQFDKWPYGDDSRICRSFSCHGS